MKLVKKIKSKTENAQIEISISVASVDRALLRGEVREILDFIADESMLTLKKSPYSKSYLHKIRVSK